MKQLMYYLAEGNTPTDEELQQCLDIQAANPDKIVILKWYFSQARSWHELWMKDRWEELKTLEDCKRNLPRFYPV